MRRKRFSTFFILIIFSIFAFGKTESRDSDTVEGSGSGPGLRGSNKNVVAADIDWEASGVGPDDEDGDVIEGSGSPPLNQKHDAVEGSGLPSVPKKPVITPDDPFPKKEEKGVEEEEQPKTTTGAPSTLPPVATTLITINKAETKDTVEVDPQNELEFGKDDNQDEEEDEDDDDDDEDDDETSTEATTTTTEKQTPPTTTRQPFNIVITDSPKADSDAESDIFQNMLQPGILAAITGGAVVGILLAILLIMFIIYRIRKKDEGSYSVDENSHHPPHYSYAYQKAATQEFYA